VLCANDEISVTIDGVSVNFSDPKPPLSRTGEY
jgi:hypothetical protein